MKAVDKIRRSVSPLEVRKDGKLITFDTIPTQYLKGYAGREVMIDGEWVKVESVMVDKLTSTFETVRKIIDEPERCPAFRKG